MNSDHSVLYFGRETVEWRPLTPAERQRLAEQWTSSYNTTSAPIRIQTGAIITPTTPAYRLGYRLGRRLALILRRARQGAA